MCFPQYSDNTKLCTRFNLLARAIKLISLSSLAHQHNLYQSVKGKQKILAYYKYEGKDNLTNNLTEYREKPKILLNILN